MSSRIRASDLESILIKGNYCAVLCCAVLYCTVLYCAMPCWEESFSQLQLQVLILNRVIVILMIYHKWFTICVVNLSAVPSHPIPSRPITFCAYYCAVVYEVPWIYSLSLTLSLSVGRSVCLSAVLSCWVFRIVQSWCKTKLEIVKRVRRIFHRACNQIHCMKVIENFVLKILFIICSANECH